MPKYEIYQSGKQPLLAVVEAKDFSITDDNIIKFYESGYCSNIIAVFKLDNIAGFKEIQEV